MDVSQYLEIFIDESKEHLQTLSDELMVLEKEPENEDTINVLSKHQNWITTSPLTNDRRHPFEKQKVSNTGTSKIMPKWMEMKFK